MKTKKVSGYIIDALFELLKTKPLSEISATELIEKAGVCRSSYYRNFYLLEDVIKAFGRELFQRISQLPPISREDPEIQIRGVYECFLTEKERLRLLDQHNLFHLLYDLFYAQCVQQIQSLKMFHQPYEVDFYAGASVFIARSWVHNGFRETPEEMARVTHSFIKWD